MTKFEIFVYELKRQIAYFGAETLLKAMKTAILSSESDSDIKLLIELANKLGVKTKILTEEDAEDLAMVYAIEKGKTGEYVDTQDFIKSLRQ